MPLVVNDIYNVDLIASYNEKIALFHLVKMIYAFRKNSDKLDKNGKYKYTS